MRLIRSVQRRMYQAAVLVLIFIGAFLPPYETSGASQSIPFRVLLPPTQTGPTCVYSCVFLIHDQATLQRFWAQHYLRVAVPKPDFAQHTVVVVGLGESACETTASIEQVEPSTPGIDVIMRVSYASELGQCNSWDWPGEIVEVPGYVAHTTIVQKDTVYEFPMDLVVLCGAPHLSFHPDVLIGGRCSRQTRLISDPYRVACYSGRDMARAAKPLAGHVNPVPEIAQISRLPLREIIVWRVKSNATLRYIPQQALYIFGVLPNTLQQVSRSGNHPMFIGLTVSLERNPNPLPEQFSTSVHIRATFASSQTTGTWRGPWEYAASFRGRTGSFSIFADCRRTCVYEFGHSVRSL